MTAKAAERIGLQTTPVREEQIRRTRNIGGEVAALPTGTVADAEANGAAGPTSVHMRVSSSELSQVDRNQPALVYKISR